jgi:CHAD domain-containing protein
LRSAIRLLDRRGRHFPEQLINDLRWLARELGLARDWDVLTTQTIPALVDGPEGKTLLGRALERRRAARERLVRQLSSVRFGRSVLRLQRWILAEDDRGKPLRGIAKPALTRAHERLLDAARFFAALSPERRHRVRILAKRLRYSLDILSIALPGGSTEQYAERLAHLQDLLGEINDFEVASLALRRVSRSPARLGQLQRHVAQLVRERLIPAEECLASLASEVPWERRADSGEASVADSRTAIA